MKKKWIDPDDAKPLTGKELTMPGVKWRIGGKVVPPDAAREAFCVALRGSKTRINIHIDDDTIAHFKAKAGERGYQTLINSALRLFVLGDKDQPPLGELTDNRSPLAAEILGELKRIGQGMDDLLDRTSSGHWSGRPTSVFSASLTGNNILSDNTVRYNS